MPGSIVFCIRVDLALFQILWSALPVPPLISAAGQESFSGGHVPVYVGEGNGCVRPRSMQMPTSSPNRPISMICRY